MKSEKDLGNECFKAKNYTEAIKHYNTYIESDHVDNKNAFFNLSLCYSKLNQPKLSIEAA